MNCRYANCLEKIKRPLPSNEFGLCPNHIARIPDWLAKFEDQNFKRRLTFHPELNPYKYALSSNAKVS